MIMKAALSRNTSRGSFSRLFRFAISWVPFAFEIWLKKNFFLKYFHRKYWPPQAVAPLQSSPATQQQHQQQLAFYFIIFDASINSVFESRSESFQLHDALDSQSVQQEVDFRNALWAQRFVFLLFDVLEFSYDFVVLICVICRFYSKQIFPSSQSGFDSSACESDMSFFSDYTYKYKREPNSWDTDWDISRLI